MGNCVFWQEVPGEVCEVLGLGPPVENLILSGGGGGGDDDDDEDGAGLIDVGNILNL